MQNILDFNKILETESYMINVEVLQAQEYAELKRWITILTKEQREIIKKKSNVRYWNTILKNLKKENQKLNPFLWNSLATELILSLEGKKVEHSQNSLTVENVKRILNM